MKCQKSFFSFDSSSDSMHVSYKIDNVIKEKEEVSLGNKRTQP